MQTTYYNTTQITDSKQLSLFSQKAKSQDEAILRFFKKFPEQQITPSDILKNSVCGDAPITSIRRSLTTLHKSFEIVKCEVKRESLYGRPETVYQLNRDIIEK